MWSLIEMAVGMSLIKQFTPSFSIYTGYQFPKDSFNIEERYGLSSERIQVRDIATVFTFAAIRTLAVLFALAAKTV